MTYGFIFSDPSELQHKATVWLQRFKARHGISSHVISGESAGVDRALIDTGRKEAMRKMEAFAPKDVFNIDETPEIKTLFHVSIKSTPVTFPGWRTFIVTFMKFLFIQNISNSPFYRKIPFNCKIISNLLC
jgi:hypothetical protein